MKKDSTKSIAFEILSVLKNYGCGKPLSLRDIECKVNEDRASKVDYHTIKRNLDLLKDLGDTDESLGFYLECRDYGEGKNKRRTDWQYFRRSDFEISEARLLMDALCAMDAVPNSQRDNLLKKLSMLPESGIATPRIEPSVQTVCNPQVFYTIEILDEAIKAQLPVKFVLGGYNTNGKVEIITDKEDPYIYQVFPLALIMQHGRYYLVGVPLYHADSDLRHYRVDLLLDIEIDEDSEIDTKSFNQYVDPVAYSAKHGSMFTGKPIKIQFTVPRERLYIAIDQFGSDVKVGKKKGELVNCTVNTNEMNVIYWAMRFSTFVTVTSPASVRDKISSMAKEMVEKYS